MEIKSTRRSFLNLSTEQTRAIAAIGILSISKPTQRKKELKSTPNQPSAIGVIKRKLWNITQVPISRMRFNVKTVIKTSI
jgi:hypothetical protein